MSASVSGMRGGQPSTTQPIAGPWLSPKIVTLKRWPKVLNDIEFRSTPCRSPRGWRGQIPAPKSVNGARAAFDEDARSGSRVPREPRLREEIDHALIDGIMRGILRRGQSEMRDQRARGAAMGSNDRVPLEALVPVADPNGHLRIAFATRRHETPFVGFARGDDMLVARRDFPEGEAFPFSECDLGKLAFDDVVGGFKPERRAQDLHGLARAHQRTRHVGEALRRAALAAEQLTQDPGTAGGLRTARGVERHVVAALQPLLEVPIGKTVPNIIDDGSRHASCASQATGSGRR